MNKSFRQEVIARDRLLAEMISQIEKKLKTFPEGGVSVKHRNNSTYYYLTGTEDGGRLLHQKDRQLISDLIQKNYLKRVLKASKIEAAALKRLQKIYPTITAEEIFDHLTSDRKKYAKRIGQADEQYIRKWEKTPFTPKEFRDGIPVYLTMKGERVRSKSEMIIADRLYANGIPYKYECPIMIGNEIIHPDFSILKVSERRVVYMEHCGKADDPDYQEDMVPRINKYILAGIFEGERLFLTFESSNCPLDVRVLDAMINKHFK